MDDDIDIEEHDLMDNPTVRSIFPDLAVLKKELLQYDYAPDVKADPVTVVTKNNHMLISFESDSSNDTSVVDNPMIIQSLVPSKQIKDSPYLYKDSRYNDKLTQRKGQKNHIGPTSNQLIIEIPKSNNIVRTQIKQKLQIKNEKHKCFKRLVFESHNVIKMPVNNETDESLNTRANPNATKTTSMNVQTIGKNKNSFAVENGRIFNPSIVKSHRALTTKHSVNVLSSINDDTNGRTSNNLNGNKIILGSKPSKLPEHTQESYVNHFIPYVAKVTLQDVSSYLHESERYCADCLILFPNNNVYDVHKTMLHSSNLHTGNNLKKYKNKPSNKCEQCQIYFIKFENLEKHRMTFHNDKANFDATNIVNKSVSQFQNKATHSLSSNHSCFHCLKLFKDQKSLIEHLYNVLEPKKKENNMTETSLKILLDEKYMNKNIIDSQEIHTQRKMSFVERKSRKENNYYQRTRILFQNLYSCPICSQYFKSGRFFKSHMAQKHKVKQMSKLKKVRFDPKCRYCSVKSTNCISYNKHLLRRHRNQNELQRIMKNQPKVIINKIQTPVIKPLKSNIEPQDDQSNSQNICGWDPFAMKSVLFKCNKCDIHFLSAKDAVLHVEHMEMLVNWKCFTCTRIFKNRDVALHIKQHTFSDYFEVYDLGESALNRVLYSCSKCAIHFTEDRYLSHYPICEFETADSAYCDLCDILVDKSSMRFHKYCHKYNKFKSTDFTIIETTIIFEKDICNKKQNVNAASMIEESENVMRVDEKCSNYIIPKAAKLCMKREKLCGNKSSSSETISKKAKFDVRKKSKSGDTNGSNKTKKKSEINNLKLTYCHTCKCFLSKLGSNREVHIQSRCAHIVKYICKYCGIMTTQKATQSHKLLHREQKLLKLQDFKFYDLKSKKQICPPIPEFPNCEICGIHFISKVAKINHECSEDDYLTCQICHTKLSEAAFKLHMLFHNYSIKNKSHPPNSVNAPKSDEIKTISSFTTSLRSSEEMTNLNEILPIIYSCTGCFIAMETYDKVIEHCQDHSARKQSLTPLLKCKTCSMKFDRSSYETHKKLHDIITVAKSSFKILFFDPIYFTSENKIWTKHVLGSLPIEQSSMILNKSIYKFEGRLKMEVIQDGPSNLTVYKCDRCRSFIDPLLVYKHAENSCFKQRKHPCSHCGLPFISTATRIEHEKIHKDPNIRLKSYRIVIFNRDGDIAFNNLIFTNQNIYVLYQCRNCNVLVNKSTFEKHKCVMESIRKCLQCGLLLYKEDFKCHMTKHKDLIKFNKERIKVILLGNETEPKNNTILELQSSFTGTICDYTFYKCLNCAICLKNEDQKLKHKCCNSTSNSKCPSCGLIFLKENLKYHLKLHGNDLDFIRNNMNIITFDGNTTSLLTSNSILNEFETKGLMEDSSIDKTKLLEKKCHKKNVDINFTSPDRTKTENIANIYKCQCGLHFVNELCARTHLNNCNPRIRASKQNCSKCDMLFTPTDLFDHLIMHHGDKNISYEFNIINIFKETTRIIYKCPNCQLHFSSANEANIHFDHCDENGNDGKECKNCSLKFHLTSFHEVCSSNFRVEIISKN